MRITITIEDDKAPAHFKDIEELRKHAAGIESIHRETGPDLRKAIEDWAKMMKKKHAKK